MLVSMWESVPEGNHFEGPQVTETAAACRKRMALFVIARQGQNVAAAAASPRLLCAICMVMAFIIM